MLDLFKAIGLGLVVLLPLANPLRGLRSNHAKNHVKKATF